MGYIDDYKQAVKDGRAENIIPDWIEWTKVDQIVIGKLLDVIPIEGDKGSYNQYLLLTDNGLEKFAVGNATDREIEPSLERNQVYAFTYLGQEKLAGGRKMNRFTVEFIAPVDSEASPVPDDSEAPPIKKGKANG